MVALRKNRAQHAHSELRDVEAQAYLKTAVQREAAPPSETSEGAATLSAVLALVAPGRTDVGK